MNNASCQAYLNTFHNFERLPVNGTSPWNLKRMRLLLEWFGHPEKSFFPVLIAGTKGKGSTGFFLESILTAAGIPNGFYSSPHLETPRERIRLNGKLITPKLWTQGIAQIRKVLSRRRSREQFTYFEIMTLLAMLSFKKAGVKTGIFEAGMGGRLDAVNVMNASLCILTPIHLDHEAVLGPTIARIAAEKAALVRSGAQVVVSPQVKEAGAVINNTVKKQKAILHSVLPVKIPAGLTGDYQRVNAGAAATAAGVLRDRFGFRIPPQAFSRGLQAGQWPGRFEKFRRYGLDFVLDGAHNPVSIEALVRNLEAIYPNRPRLVVFGTSRDKKSQPMLETLSRYFPEIVLTRAGHSRSTEIPVLLAQAQGRKTFRRIYPQADVKNAVAFAREHAAKGSLIVITGSFYVIGEARKILKD